MPSQVLPSGTANAISASQCWQPPQAESPSQWPLRVNSELTGTKVKTKKSKGFPSLDVTLNLSQERKTMRWCLGTESWRA